jgi:uncharacterized protein (TIGR01777 family)
VPLPGEPIAARCPHAKRRAIRESRVSSTALLCERLARCERRPRVLVSASAVGFYGDRGDESLDESADAGTGFLAGVCREWEEATKPAAEAGIRVVCLRTGPVLAAAGGVLGNMLPLFRLGLGGPLGDGRQYLSWIALDDTIGAIHFALFCEGLSGPVNATAPGAARSSVFASTLGKVLGRPSFVPAPASMLRAALGQMAEEALLASARVRPAKLEAAGFRFCTPYLESALRAELGRAG